MLELIDICPSTLINSSSNVVLSMVPSMEWVFDNCVEGALKKHDGWAVIIVKS